MRNLGEILASFGTFMLLSGLRLGFTKYQLDREQDLSMFLGGVGFSLLVLAVGFSLIRKAKAAARREALETDRPRRAGGIATNIACPEDTTGVRNRE